LRSGGKADQAQEDKVCSLSGYHRSTSNI